MTTKMKGLFKGLRYISQIFDEEKEQEMQIGFPTDVKHVAHIGWDGPAVDSPSWMKEFNSSATGFSAPLGLPGDLKDNPEIQWVSEDSKRGQRTKSSQANKDPPEVPKSSRRQSSTDSNSNDSPRKKDPSTKSRQSRRKEAKDSSDSSIKSSQQPQESICPAPDIPRKSRRKKSKELVNEGGSRRSRNRATTSNGTDTSTDPGPDTGSLSQLSPVPTVDDEATESRVTFKE